MDTIIITRVYFLLSYLPRPALERLYCCLIVLMIHLFVFSNHYTTGPADLLFNGKPTGLKGLKLIFDTGSSYTYFNSKAYQTIISLVILQETQRLKKIVWNLMHRSLSRVNRSEMIWKSHRWRLRKKIRPYQSAGKELSPLNLFLRSRTFSRP